MAKLRNLSRAQEDAVTEGYRQYQLQVSEAVGECAKLINEITAEPELSFEWLHKKA